ncbi:MAG: adenylate/guanylate cyclase domain-containing protein [Desulfobacula sp.]|jgi:adenylate cyclase|uniref:CHASE2 domain-containing protein n=1 Tax=Desulfobacula sp. TaxID=2593537 RepID=UPI001D7AAF9C|nr:adenylate/guanylate cyclase domain-containing protein [Desulfobacula sp.]MBT3485664.1 adenylate/guanylate cyclase domain-containing protein [Desulfobacula sp.]MBT3804527.1 adenylate/guanylate cyclase domain-containing protein [Desulfobacula sp.]MBT4025814.1 adenylate/guanylate cyclase domain-containing protein [Desulfobacula sp.]MBT4199228.1 adenylate/guanylate cyclase domain-containing protein [Desulfobacula sp.]
MLFKKSLLIIFISCILVEICTYNNWLPPLEQVIYDTYHRMAKVRSGYTPHVVIIAIDAKTLNYFKEDPLVFWGPHFAQAISALGNAGAAAIGIDLIFSINPESWLQKMKFDISTATRSINTLFQKQIHSSKIVLAGQVTWSKENHELFNLPAVEYMYALSDGPASVGLVNLFQDSDGVVRSFYEKLFDDNRKPDTAFAPLLAMKAGYGNPGSKINRIGYIGPPGTIPRVSLMDLFTSDAKALKRLALLLKDKIAIISVEQDGFNDSHITPYSGGLLSGNINLMKGGEIHANIIETIISEKSLKDLPVLFRVAWLIVAVSAFVFFAQALGPKRGLAVNVLILVIFAVFSYILFLTGILAPIINLALALILSFLGILSTKLTHEEKERLQMKKKFGPYVSESVLEEIIKQNKLPTLGGEEIEITAMFSDIRNFTTISEKLSPAEVVEFLNHYYSQVCDLVTSNKGIVDKFIGDAVMVIFGAPLPTPDHGKRCLKTALAMLETAIEFKVWLNKRFPDRDIPEFQIGIGIHTGKALVGNIGSRQRMEYTAIGDTINIASRLEGLCKKLGWTIVASQTTIKATEHEVVFGRKEKIQPRGRSGSIEIVEVLGMKPDARNKGGTNEKI